MTQVHPIQKQWDHLAKIRRTQGPKDVRNLLTIAVGGPSSDGRLIPWSSLQIFALRDIPREAAARRNRSVALFSRYRPWLSGQIEIGPKALLDRDLCYRPFAQEPVYESKTVDAVIAEKDYHCQVFHQYGRTVVYLDGQPSFRVQPRHGRVTVKNGQRVVAGQMLACSNRNGVLLPVEIFTGRYHEARGDIAHLEKDAEFLNLALGMDEMADATSRGEMPITGICELAGFQKFYSAEEINALPTSRDWVVSADFKRKFVEWASSGAPVKIGIAGKFVRMEPLSTLPELSRPVVEFPVDDGHFEERRGDCLPSSLILQNVEPGDLCTEDGWIGMALPPGEYQFDELKQKLGAQLTWWYSLFLRQVTEPVDGGYLLPIAVVPYALRRRDDIFFAHSEEAGEPVLYPHPEGWDYRLSTISLPAWDDLTGRFLGPDMFCDFTPHPRRLASQHFHPAVKATAEMKDVALV